MAFYKEVGKNTESTTLDNRVVSTDDLRVKVKQILQERQWHQIEPVEVIDVITNTDVATKQDIPPRCCCTTRAERTELFNSSVTHFIQNGHILQECRYGVDVRINPTAWLN